MADLKKAIRKWLKERGFDMEDFEEKPQPVMEMRKKQGEGMWQADIMDEEETEEEKQRKKKIKK